MQGVQNILLYLLSIINPVALQIGALSVITCTTLSGPTCSIAEIKTSSIKWDSFSSPEQSSALKNIAPAGEDAMILINGLHLVSIHPFEIMDTLELAHEFRIGLDS